MLRHRAVTQEQGYIAEGYSYVVDVDLETFFDRANHDSRMARVAARVSDKRALELTVPAFLTAGAMESGWSFRRTPERSRSSRPRQ